MDKLSAYKITKRKHSMKTMLRNAHKSINGLLGREVFSSRLFIITILRCVICFFLCFAILFCAVFTSLFKTNDPASVLPNASNFAVHYIDVGQGDCTAINFPDGKVALIDGGTSAYSPVIADYLRKRVTRNKIDYLIATHPHNDHYGGLISLISEFDIDTIYRPVSLSTSALEPYDIITGMPLADSRFAIDNQEYADFITEAYDSGASVKFLTDDLSSIQGENYLMRFHEPSTERLEVLARNFSDANDLSAIITVEYMSHVFVFTGDGGEDVERAFWTAQDNPSNANAISFDRSTTWLQVGHHGSEKSSHLAFLNTIRIDKAIFSYSINNTSFPNETVYTRIANIIGEDNIYSTALDGNIAVVFDDNEYDIIIGPLINSPKMSVFLILVIIVVLFVCFARFPSTLSNDTLSIKF